MISPPTILYYRGEFKETARGRVEHRVPLFFVLVSREGSEVYLLVRLFDLLLSGESKLPG